MMDISRFTPEQRESIVYEGGHLFIRAGAGTGKTATLTAKVAYLLGKDNSLDFESVRQLLAITFTDKAAAELVSRIRSTMRAEGMTADALNVDGAWISTIHGMCARILREHAFELGMDPSFRIMSNAEEDLLLQQVVEQVVSDDAGLQADSAYDILFREFPAKGMSGQSGAISVESLLSSLVPVLATLPGGAADLHMGPPPRDTADIARGLLDITCSTLELYGTYDKKSKTVEAAIESGRQIMTLLGPATCAGGPMDDDILFEVLEECKPMTCSVRDQTFKEASAAHKDAFHAAYGELCQRQGYALLRSFCNLASVVIENMRIEKAASGMMDNNDLIRCAYHALLERPSLAARYEGLFRLLMIDEFQDTSRLQVLIARLLDTGEGRQLCTVGDAQQSIYGFRGADVELFRRFERELPPGSASKRLGTNFRSHADILAFVNKVFGAPGVFGDDYLTLQAPAARRDPAFDTSIPRIDILLTTGDTRRSDLSAVPVDTVVDVEARLIAERFKALRDSGWRPSQMVLLLRAMTKADRYADALREQGFEAVISGGSVFWQGPAPALVGAMLRFLANPFDNDAAYRLLASPLIALSSDELALLACDGQGSKRSLYEGLLASEADAPARIRFARELCVRALTQANGVLPSEALTRMLVESGYLTRLSAQQATGRAVCADLLKALRYVEKLEGECPAGFAAVACAYDALAVDPPKDAPGALMVKDDEAIQIMTVHASKGLEFPIVAIGGFERKPTIEKTMLCRTGGGETYVSLLPGDKLSTSFGKRHPGSAGYEPLDRSVRTDALEAPDISRDTYHRLLMTYAAQEATAEMRRLFYVAATRAREALILALHPTTDTRGNLSRTPVIDDIGALFEGGMLPAHDAEVDYGGSATARLTYTHIARDESGELVCREREGLLEASEEASSGIPELPELFPPDAPSLRVGRGEDGTIEFSYSSIDPKGHEDVEGTGNTDTLTEDVFQLGLAFHLIAEHLVDSGSLGDGRVTAPDPVTVQRLVSSFSLSDSQRERLGAALATWVSSGVAIEAAGYPSLRAEVPFYQVFEDEAIGERCYLNGEIDLLCRDASGRHALIVDYKTGGSEDETVGQLKGKHRLQALCYTEAVLAQGAEKVEVVFVRVERRLDDGQPQTVRYVFGDADAADVHAEIAGYLETAMR